MICAVTLLLTLVVLTNKGIQRRNLSNVSSLLVICWTPAEVFWVFRTCQLVHRTYWKWFYLKSASIRAIGNSSAVAPGRVTHGYGAKVGVQPKMCYRKKMQPNHKIPSGNKPEADTIYTTPEKNVVGDDYGDITMRNCLKSCHKQHIAFSMKRRRNGTHHS